MIKRISKNNQSVVVIILVFIVLVTTACTDKLNNNKGMDAETKKYQVNTNDHSTDIENDLTEAKEKSDSINPNYSSINYTRVIIMKKLNLIAIGNFYEGLASAQNSDGLYGFVDYKGNWIIQPMYINVNDFSNGLALVKNTDNSQYINPVGNVVLDSDNFDGYNFQRNFDSDGTTVISGMIEKDGSRKHYSSVIDMKGNIVIDGKELNVYNISYSRDGNRIAENNKITGGTSDVGVINNKGYWIIEPSFDEIEFYDDNTVIVSKVNSNRKILESGVMTLKGTWIIEPNGIYIQDHGYGLIVYYSMSEPQKMELYDMQDNILLNGESFQSIKIIDENLVSCSKNDSTPYQLYWIDGRLAFNDLRVNSGYFISDNTVFASVSVDEKPLWGLVDTNNPKQWMIEPKYEAITSFEGSTSEGIVVIEHNNNVTFYLEKFDISGLLLSKSEELKLPYNQYKAFSQIFFAE